MAITKEKQEALVARMAALKIHDADLDEKFILGSGSGGQKINKTASCVYIKHLPSGIEIKCQRSRSRELNRYYARTLLCEKIEQVVLKEQSAKEKEIHKIRRQKKRRSRRQKEKILKEKKSRSSLKELRRSPKNE